MPGQYDLEREFQGMIYAYEHLVGGIDATARDGAQTRAYGGIIRAGKGKLVESLAKQVVELAWTGLGQGLDRLLLTKKKVKVPLRREYLARIKSPEVRNYVSQNVDTYYYGVGVDQHVFVDDRFAIAMECKAYTENAMLKRVLVDFTLLKQIHEHIATVLFQLESQLGGDYSEWPSVVFGSRSTHTLLSYFDVDLQVVTLLKGERKVDRPIHKKGFYKPLTKEALSRAIEAVSQILEDYV